MIPETRKPKVVLYNYTLSPQETIAGAVSAWTSDSFYEHICDVPIDVTDKNVNAALNAFHRTALEFIDLIFIIKNCSRAFQQQLTRTRLATYSIQSLRVVTKGNFAEEGRYTRPPGLSEEQAQVFHSVMVASQVQYNELIRSGVPVEDARGVLPLAIHSDIMMKINLSSLYNMSKQRLCVNTQWEYRQVVRQMRQIIADKIDHRFAKRIDAPCVIDRACPMRDEYCGVPVWKYSAKDRDWIFENYINKTEQINWLNCPSELGAV
jgi:thymidylate synthase (FAD)